MGDCLGDDLSHCSGVWQVEMILVILIDQKTGGVWSDLMLDGERKRLCAFLCGVCGLLVSTVYIFFLR